MRIAATLVALTAVSLLLRTGTMETGYWIDEAISVGIASHDLLEIPAALRKDGSPPLYYLLLHVWMQLVGTGEAATRALSLGFALLAVPAAWWAGRAVCGPRAGALAAAGAAVCPFLTYYAQETRMYSLVMVLSLLAAASFVLAFLHGRREHLALLGAWLVLLLYTHSWGVFLVAGMAVAWVALWRQGKVEGRDGARLGAAVGLLYLPWLPSALFQAGHTGAPWAERPTPLYLLAIAVAAVAAIALRDGAARSLAAIAAATAGLAWLSSQLEPAWSARYLAVLFGPLLLGLAVIVARGSRWTGVAVPVAATVWLLAGTPAEKSNARTAAAGVAPAIRPGDLVVSTQPEQVPVLHRYLPRGVVYVTPIGIVADPRLTDWRNGLARMRDGRAESELLPLLDLMEPGRRVLLVTPVARRSPPQAPWSRAVRARTREWRAALRADPRLRTLARAPAPPIPRARSTVRIELFEVR